MYVVHAMIVIFMQDQMVAKKAAPRNEDEPDLTDLQIVQLVLSEKSPSTTCNSTFLPRLGVATSSRKSSVSATRIRELQQRLADQEQNSIQAAERYHSEMQARLQEQDEKFEEIRKKQEEELEAVKKAQEEKTLAYEKRLAEMDAVLNLLLRTSQPPSMSQSQGN